MKAGQVINMLSVDVEDYFHVSAFERISSPSTWHSYESRVEKNTEKILHILNSFDIKATFFILGWVARHSPQIVMKIASMGHEVASHGYGHRRVSCQCRGDFRQDVRDSKALLEDLVGCPVKGYRAPSYSICMNSLWAFDELLEAGYSYDSSVFPVTHDFYGIPDWPRFPFPLQRVADGNWLPGRASETCRDLVEVPISTLHRKGRNLPIAGGGYFRLYPYSVTRKGLHEINVSNKRPFIFYIHPWEFDPDQPRMKGVGLKSRVRHYLNLSRTEKRFNWLLKDFNFSSIADVLRLDSSSGNREMVPSRAPCLLH